MRWKIVLLAALLYLFYLPRGAETWAATMTLSPISASTTVGGSFTVDINLNITEAQGAFIANTALKFNPNILDVTNVTNLSNFFPQLSYNFDAAVGELRVGGYIDNLVNFPAVTGTGVLAQITFSGKNVGSTSVSFLFGTDADSVIFDPGGNNILDPNTLNIGSYSVNAAPAPTCGPPNSCGWIDPGDRVPGIEKNCPAGFFPLTQYSCPVIPEPTSGLVLVNVCCPPTPPPDVAYQTCDSCGNCPGTGNPPPPNWDECMRCHEQNGRWTIAGCIPESAGGFTQSVLQIFTSVVGGLAFLALLYGGGIVLTSRGDPDRLISGKSIVRGALIGVAVVLLAVFLLEFVGVTIFGIPGLK